MIITFVIDSYKNRSNGTSMTAFRFARELVRLGHEVRVVATGLESSSADFELGDEGEKIYSVKEHYIPLVTEVSKRQHMIFGKSDVNVFSKALVGSDIVHFFMPFKLEIDGMHFCRKMNIPYISAFHVQPQHISYNMNMDFEWFNNYLYMRFYRAFYRYTHHIHCPSKLMATELDRIGYDAKKYIISNGFKLNSENIEKIPFEDNYFHIATVGRLSKEKRQDILIKAISQSKYANNIKLHLHGVGPREQYLKKLCDNLLKAPYEFGYMSNDLLMQNLSSMDLYVHPAQVESEAISCLEAISFGIVPVIADSKISATNQFALDERSIFETNNIDNLVSKIEYWIEHKDEIRVMSPKYKQSSLQYSLDTSIKKILEVYEEAIRDFKDNNDLFHRVNCIVKNR